MTTQVFKCYFRIYSRWLSKLPPTSQIWFVAVYESIKTYFKCEAI